MRRMLYRPNYCSNCGEKVERVDWGFFTSRRFCDICETEFKGHDILVRAGIGLALVIGIIGVGAYLRSGSTTELVKQPTKLVERVAPAESEPRPRATELPSPAARPDPSSNSPVALVAGSKPPQAKVEIAESQYFCGAETKKGTPCSRRVKGNIRCYQHVGMPAMTTSERSKTN